MIAKINEQTIHYTVHGRGLPIIILHGFYLDSVSMIRAIEDTKVQLNGFKRIYVDMPGMGQSPRHQLKNNSDTMINLLCDFISDVVGDHPFIVMGYSYGGYIVQGIAKRFISQIIGEVLICPVVVPQPERRIKASIMNQDIDEAFFSTLDVIKQRDLLSRMVVINERTYRRNQSDFYRAHALADNDFLEELYHSDNYASEYIESNLVTYPYKTLIFLGYQDIVVGYQDMLDRLHYYPKANVNLLSNASHSFFLEQPMQFEYILNSWLSQYKTRGV